MAVTDLTNTKWLLNETLGTTTPNGRPYDYGIDHKYNEDYSINFTNGSINYTSFDFRGMGEGSSTVLEYTGTGVYLLVASLSADYAWWEDEAYKTIEITGGTDATNSNLISWLTSNATQITSGGSMYLGTSTISKMYLGQNEVSKVYLGQDLVYEKQASGYSVSVENRTSYPINIYDGQDNTGTLLGTLKGTITQTFNVTSGYIYADTLLYEFFDSEYAGHYGNPLRINEDCSLILRGGGD